MSGTTAEQVVDPGLQPERTSLAWRRAAVSFLGLGLAIPKVTWTALGAWSLLPAAIAIVGATAVLALSHRRYRRRYPNVAGSAEARLRPADGALVASSAVLALLLGLLGLYVIVDSAVHS